jgi:hypothetical protein
VYAGWEGDSGNTLRGNTANDNARNGIYAFGATGEESFHEVVKSYGSMFLQDAVNSEAMGQAEILIAGLLMAVTGPSALARHLSVPYPVVLVVGGALLGFVPGLPEVKLDHEVVVVGRSTRGCC